METNALYYGDNLGILRDFIPDASVDLVYLDPPFNSNRDYNGIFKDAAGARSDASILAFEDTWHWGPDARPLSEGGVSAPGSAEAAYSCAFEVPNMNSPVVALM